MLYAYRHVALHEQPQCGGVPGELFRVLGFVLLDFDDDGVQRRSVRPQAEDHIGVEVVRGPGVEGALLLADQGGVGKGHAHVVAQDPHRQLRLFGEHLGECVMWGDGMDPL
ncbi:hypothetical protein ACWEPN_29645 [Nonomuraea wenchangensis]